MKSVAIVGAGDLGSRHLQALRAIQEPLVITVVDPSERSLARARERYAQVDGGPDIHIVKYANGISPSASPVDLVIVATDSRSRRQAVEQMLLAWDVRHLLLEKILFSQLEDYAHVGGLLTQKDIPAWVNCCRRTMPFHAGLGKEYAGAAIQYHVTGSLLGLGTSAIHHLDFVGYLTGCHECEVDAGWLDPILHSSKRDGFVDLTGTLRAVFANGSEATVTSHPSGDAPIVVSIESAAVRTILHEGAERAWTATVCDRWGWREAEALVPLQSEMTTGVVQGILARGDCALTPYAESARYHLAFIKAVLPFVNEHAGRQYSYCPLT